MKKIKTSTVEMTGPVEVIFTNSRLVAKCVESHVALQQILTTHVKRKYNDETKKWEDDLDANGTPQREYDSINSNDAEQIAGIVKTFIDELYDALVGEDK